MIIQETDVIYETDIVGIDEVGYGCWAGPVYVCALRLIKPSSHRFFDSKSISHAKRIELSAIIAQVAVWQIGVGSVEEINQRGLAYAYRKAIERAIEPFETQRLVIDGRRPSWMSYLNCTAVIKGDEKIQAISAASIIAKVERDRLMSELAKVHPQYGFERNKGYGTAEHIAALGEHGFCGQHRTSYDLEKYLR